MAILTGTRFSFVSFPTSVLCLEVAPQESHMRWHVIQVLHGPSVRTMAEDFGLLVQKLVARHEGCNRATFGASRVGHIFCTVCVAGESCRVSGGFLDLWSRSWFRDTRGATAPFFRKVVPGTFLRSGWLEFKSSTRTGDDMSGP